MQWCLPGRYDQVSADTTGSRRRLVRCDAPGHRGGWLARLAVVAILITLAQPTSGKLDARTLPPSVAADDSSTVFTVGVVGDHGATAASAEVLRAVGADRPNFFLSLGDLSLDQLTEPAWCQFVKDNLNLGAGLNTGNAWGETYPFEIAVGNHEAYNVQNFVTSACLPDRLGAVPAPGGSYGRQYSLDYPAAQPLARFIITEPGIADTYTNGSPELAWLSATIDQARAAGIPWVVAVNHENYITTGDKTNEIGSDYFNLLVGKRVDLILQGHDHTYQRSKQLAQNAGCPLVPTGTANPLCIADDGSDAHYVAGTGSLLLIDGTGGQPSYTIDPADPEAPYFAVAIGANTNTRGFTRLTFTTNALMANFVRSGGGAFADSFEIARTPDVSPPTAPSSLNAQAVSSSRVDLVWPAATDDRGIARYQIVRDGVTLPDVVTSLSASVSGLSPSTAYTFTVRAVDLAGNVGPESPAATATTLPSAATLFVEGWNTSDGSPWLPSAWTTQSSQGVVDVVSNTGRLQFNDQAAASARASLTGVSPVTDSDLVFSYQWSSSAARAYFNIYLRGSGGWQNSYRPLNGYGVQIQNDSTTATLSKNVGGTVTTLRSISGAQRVGTARQWVRFRVVGSLVQVRLWADGQPEPATWNATVTDSTVSGAGQVFLSLNRSSSNSGVKAITLDDLSLSDASSPAPDTTSPSAPANLQATTTSTTVTLTWEAATDNVAVTGYQISRDGVLLTTVPAGTWTYTDTGLSPATSYSYDVVAIDAVPNLSSPATRTATTAAAPDTVLFTDAWSGANGAPWSPSWVSLTSQGVVDTQSDAGRLGVNDVRNASARASLTDVAPVTDSDLVFSYQWNSSARRAYFNIYLRGSGGWQNSYRPLNGYGVEIQNDSTTATLSKNVGGKLTTLRSISGAQRVGTARQWLRFRVVGSLVQVRLWADGQPEPATWNATVTDSTVSGAGQVFLSLNRSSSNSGVKAITVDDLSLRTATGP